MRVEAAALGETGEMTWQEFEALARVRMGREFNTEFTSRVVPGAPKKFDMVSSDAKVVGDAKYLTLVRGERIPPAKFMEIAGHVWLLGSVEAERRFLVFGNQREVPEAWLRKYGALVRGVDFYFLPDDGALERLNGCATCRADNPR